MPVLKIMKRLLNILKNGAKYAEDKDVYYYNAGIIYYITGKFTLAEDMFTQAIRSNSSNTSSYLNRANSRLKLTHKEDAVSDYRLFLNLEPDNYQKESIEKLISLLEEEITLEKNKQRRGRYKKKGRRGKEKSSSGRYIKFS